MTLTALGLKWSLLGEISSETKLHRVSTTATVRVADRSIRPGVTYDESSGGGEWPGVRPTDPRRRHPRAWHAYPGGSPGSHAQRELERLDAFLVETGPDGRSVWLDRVAIVGNEDGAHHVAAELFRPLNGCRVHYPGRRHDLLGRRGHAQTDYQDLASGGEKADQATSTSTANAAHLARLLADDAYPALS